MIWFTLYKLALSMQSKSYSYLICYQPPQVSLYTVVLLSVLFNH